MRRSAWMLASALTLSAASAMAAGLIVDGDADGVPFADDLCPYTPSGLQVDATGCELPVDADRDGVLDSDDVCPLSPKGSVVDRQGCAVDSDFDGVADGIDKCPATPSDARVNERGCPLKEARGQSAKAAQPNSRSIPVIRDNVPPQYRPRRLPPQESSTVSSVDSRPADAEPGPAHRATPVLDHGGNLKPVALPVARNRMAGGKRPTGRMVDSPDNEPASAPEPAAPAVTAAAVKPAPVAAPKPSPKQTPPPAQKPKSAPVTKPGAVSTPEPRSAPVRVAPTVPVVSYSVVDKKVVPVIKPDVSYRIEMDPPIVVGKSVPAVTTGSPLNQGAAAASVPKPRFYQPVTASNAYGVLLEKVNFRHDSADLGRYARTLLNRAVSRMRGDLARDPATRFLIAGHADGRGYIEQGDTISRGRAEAVRDYLVEAGIPAASLTVTSFGFQKPLSTSGTASADARNRRVEIRVR